MNVLNAVRNKLLPRVLACVNNGKNYVIRPLEYIKKLFFYVIEINGVKRATQTRVRLSLNATAFTLTI